MTQLPLRLQALLAAAGDDMCIVTDNCKTHDSPLDFQKRSRSLLTRPTNLLPKQALPRRHVSDPSINRWTSGSVFQAATSDRSPLFRGRSLCDSAPLMPRKVSIAVPVPDKARREDYGPKTQTRSSSSLPLHEALRASVTKPRRHLTPSRLSYLSNSSLNGESFMDALDSLIALDPTNQHKPC